MARLRSGYIVAKGGKKTLPTFNIRVGKHRTSVRLSPVAADAVEQIADRERCELNELYSHIDRTKEKGVSRATAIRDFALEYFMDAATESGHRREGHGKLIGQATSQARAAAKKRRSKA